MRYESCSIESIGLLTPPAQSLSISWSTSRRSPDEKKFPFAFFPFAALLVGSGFVIKFIVLAPGLIASTAPATTGAALRRRHRAHAGGPRPTIRPGCGIGSARTPGYS